MISVRLGLAALVAGAVLAGVATFVAPSRPVPDAAPAGDAEVPTVLAAREPTPTLTTVTTTLPPTTTTPPTASSEPTTTTPEPTTTSTVAPTTTQSASLQQRVVDLVNEERRRAGCQALRTDSRLTNAAQAHSVDMATNRYFSHTSLDGRTFADRIRAAGYPRPGAENLAKGQRSAERVVRSWMASTGHRANILDCSLIAIGIGIDTRGWYWTQDFGR